MKPLSWINRECVVVPVRHLCFEKVRILVTWVSKHKRCPNPWNHFLEWTGECVVVLVRHPLLLGTFEMGLQKNPSNMSTKHKGCLNHESLFCGRPLLYGRCLNPWNHYFLEWTRAFLCRRLKCRILLEYASNMGLTGLSCAESMKHFCTTQIMLTRNRFLRAMEKQMPITL